MKYALLIICFLAAVAGGSAQTKVSGHVVEKTNGDPLTGASVIIKGADGKIKKFTTSAADGSFRFDLPEIAGCKLEVSMMSYAKKTLSLDSVSGPITVYMEPGDIILKEVRVKADRIREQGDTLTYGVSQFAQQQDRSIGDVLKRMPGIDVAQNGKIQYQGEDINKFYIEGSDLLGGKYGIATNGIRHEDVGAVEVMENHQPMQVLSGLSFSDKAAINLKLKNKAKATWSFHGSAGAGYSWQPAGAVWDGELFAMAVMPSFQNITTFKTDNTGKDLSAQATDFFASRRGTDLSRYVSVGLPGVPNLNSTRTRFNRSALVSTNNLWKIGRGEVKAQVDYSYNQRKAEAADITTYFLTDGSREVVENRSGKDRSNSLSAKVIYELNQKTAFINNTLKTNLDWDRVDLSVSGSLPNIQSSSLPDYYVGNDFKLIKRIKGKHLVTIKSIMEWEALPQTLSVGTGTENGDLPWKRQEIKDHAFYTNESVAYAFTLKGVTVSLEGGIEGYLRNMHSDLTGWSDPAEIISASDGFVNTLHTNYFGLYVTPKLEYWVKRVNLTLNLPVNFEEYTFDKAIANRSEIYFSPSLSMNWKPNNKFSFGIRGGTGRSPMDLNMIHPGLIMTDYRTFRYGVDDFYSSSSQSLSANLAYKYTRKGVFANAMVVHSWRHSPFTTVQQLIGDYIFYSYSPASSSGKMLMASGSVGKTLDFMRGSANISGSLTRNSSHLISENKDINSVSTGWSVGFKVNGSPLSWMSFDYRMRFSSSRLAMNVSKVPWLKNLENELLINIMPHRKWEWHIVGTHYRNELTAGTYKNVFLLDTKLVYKLSKRIELSAMLYNLLDQRTYNYTSYNQLSSFESRRWLRGRELLFTISLRK